MKVWTPLIVATMGEESLKAFGPGSRYFCEIYVARTDNRIQRPSVELVSLLRWQPPLFSLPASTLHISRLSASTSMVVVLIK